jgi:hypothetical protein
LKCPDESDYQFAGFTIGGFLGKEKPSFTKDMTAGISKTLVKLQAPLECQHASEREKRFCVNANFPQPGRLKNPLFERSEFGLFLAKINLAGWAAGLEFLL